MQHSTHALALTLRARVTLAPHFTSSHCCLQQVYAKNPLMLAMADASQSVKDMCSFGLPLKIDNTAKARFATTPKTTPQETGPPLDPGKENTALVVQAPSNPSDARPGKALCERNNSITLSTGANVNKFLGRGPVSDAPGATTSSASSGGNNFQTQTSDKREGVAATQAKGKVGPCPAS